MENLEDLAARDQEHEMMLDGINYRNPLKIR
jgi:hypothetical protein